MGEVSLWEEFMKKVRYFCDVCLKEKPIQEYILPCKKCKTEKNYFDGAVCGSIYRTCVSSEKKDICDDCADNIITAIKIANAKSVQSDDVSEALKGDLDRLIKL